jgi:transmembrane sensor
MSKRDFEAGLRAAEYLMTEFGVPAEVDLRLRKRLQDVEQGTPQRRTRWVPIAATASLMIAAATVLVTVASPMVTKDHRLSSSIGGLEVLGPTNDLRSSVGANQVVDIEAGGCTLVDAARGISLVVTSPVRIRKDADGVRVARGIVDVRVEKRRSGLEPVRVLVSDGSIEVMGTRFTVEQGEASGRVRLHDGAIRFRSSDGRTVDLRPGDSLAWPLPAPPRAVGESGRNAASPRDPILTTKNAQGDRATAPPISATEFARSEELLERIAVMRSRGQYRQAVQELSDGLNANLSPAARERLSFELGSLLTYQLEDGSACRYWDDHARRFPAGRYDDEIRHAREHLRCADH